MSFLRCIIGILLVISVAVLAFMNNQMVDANLWPFYINITVSLSVVIVVLVLCGFLFGKIDSWLAYSPLRSALRNQKRQNKKLNAEQQKLVEKVEGLKENLHNINTASPLSVQQAKEPGRLARIKQKLLRLIKKKPTQDDFWCL